MSKIVNVPTIRNMVVCFVCDQKVSGEKVNLASSVSSHSEITLPEKISQLIGDDYVVAVAEHDCLCKRCASLLNHMDKLENELTLVKKALTTSISQKYKITLDGQALTQQTTLANGGLKTDSASDHEEETRKSNPDLNASLPKKKTPLPNKPVPTTKPTKPAENVTKLKIYKCGFCSYQSKELSNVRLHMKIHIRANKSETEGEKPAVPGSPLFTPKTPVSVRRRVFRCQVCSASFDDRNKCLEHISRDHTAAGRKMVGAKQNHNQNQQGEHSQIAKQAETLTENANPVNSDQSTTESQQISADDRSSQEEMDTTEAPSIALYSCDTCSSSFNNDVDFANHVNDHAKMDATDSEKKEVVEGESVKNQEIDFTDIPSQSDSQDATEEEGTKDSSMGLDIEAMIAALHSEGPAASDSMPSI